jgi:hypothetical protein
MESVKRCPVMVAQRNTKLARPHPGTKKRTRQKLRLLLDTPLSSNVLLANSSRHSVTSRIAPNSRSLRYLIFSTRHLNATPEKRSNVEKFNTGLRFFAASHSSAKLEIAPHIERSHDRSSTFPCAYAARNSELITQVTKEAMRFAYDMLLK